MSYRKSSSDEVREWFYLLAEMTILPLVGMIACSYFGGSKKEGEQHVCDPIYNIIGWVQSKFTKENVSLMMNVIGKLTGKESLVAAAGHIDTHFEKLENKQVAKNVLATTQIAIPSTNVPLEQGRTIQDYIKRLVDAVTYFQQPDIAVAYFLSVEPVTLNVVFNYCDAIFNENYLPISRGIIELQKVQNFDARFKNEFENTCTSKDDGVAQFFVHQYDVNVIRLFAYFFKLKTNFVKQTEFFGKQLTDQEKAFVFVCYGLLITLVTYQRFVQKENEVKFVITVLYMFYYQTSEDYQTWLAKVSVSEVPMPSQ